jgi:hypothetical protein
MLGFFAPAAWACAVLIPFVRISAATSRVKDRTTILRCIWHLLMRLVRLKTVRGGSPPLGEAKQAYLPRERYPTSTIDSGGVESYERLFRTIEWVLGTEVAVEELFRVVFLEKTSRQDAL